MDAAVGGDLDVVFHDVAFNLSVTLFHDGTSDVLAIDLEELGAGASWHGEFSASFVEGMTMKTGSFKAFDVFAKMLRGALWQESDTVFVDLLTYADLVRRRAAGRGFAAAAAAAAAARGAARTARSNTHPAHPPQSEPEIAGGAQGQTPRRGCAARDGARRRRRGGKQEALPHPDLRRRV
jgi:hypothetical protein